MNMFYRIFVRFLCIFSFFLFQCRSSDKDIEKTTNYLLMKNKKHALTFLNHLANFKRPHAFYLLGNLALNGIKNDKKLSNAKAANVYFEEAAKMNHLKSISSLAGAYFVGDGVKKDYKKSITLYKKAADLGDSNAQFNLGIIYKKGYGVLRDKQKAIYYFNAYINNPNVTILKDNAQSQINDIDDDMKNIMKHDTKDCIKYKNG